MKRKDFLRISVPAFLLLANGEVINASNFVLNEEERKKVKLRFVVASDGHYGQKKTDYLAWHEETINRINEEHDKNPFAFCMINGDIIHDDPSFYPEAKQALDRLHPKYYVSQGNHDHISAEEWLKIWNIPVNYDFVINDTAILIGTTSNAKGTYLCPDLAWFTATLPRYKDFRNIFIFLHINPVCLTTYARDCPDFARLLEQYKNVRAVFNGHDHQEDGIKTWKGIPYIFDGHFGGNFGVDYHGFRIVELRNDNSILTYILNPTEKINEASISKTGKVKGENIIFS